jgi:hypothetical protein
MCSGAPRNLSLEHDLIRKPVPTPDQVRDKLFRDQARSLHRSIAGLHGAHAVLPVAWRA